MAIAQKFDDDVLNSIIKRSLISTAPKEKTEVLTEKNVVKVSNTITSLQNAFNKIYAYTQNVKNIHKLEEKRLQNIKKEVTMETKTSTATFAGGMSIEVGNLPDVFKQLTESVEELTKNLDKLDMSSKECDVSTGTADIDDDDDDFDRRRRRRRRGGRRGGGRGRGRTRGTTPRPRGRLGFGGRFLLGIGFDMGAGAFGVGQGIDEEALAAQDELNWQRATTLEKIQSSIPRGIEMVGDLFGLSNISAQARADRVKSETEYLERTRPRQTGATRQLEQAAGNVTRQQARLEKGKPLGSTSFSSRFANYLDLSINNMAQWALTASPMLAAIAAAAGGVMNIFSPNIGDLTLSGDTRADFQTIMEMAAAAGAPRPEIVAAQWALESGWGKHMSGRNNPFGQKAGRNEPGTLRRTREVVNGQSVYIQDRFKDYASLQDAIAEHVRRWNARYTTAEMTPLEAIQAIASRGYATDPNYVASIARILAGQNIDPRSEFRYTPPASGMVQRAGGVGSVTSRFGMRGGRMHKGIDIGAPTGTPVASLFGGTIEFAGRADGYGNVIYVNQDNGYQVRYGHLHRFAPGIRDGVRVSATQVIGEVGSTGRSTGPHLHLEIRRGDVPLDPLATYNSNRWIVGGTRNVPTPAPAPRPRPRQPPPSPTLGQRLDNAINAVTEFFGFGDDAPPPAPTSPTFTAPQIRR